MRMRMTHLSGSGNLERATHASATRDTEKTFCVRYGEVTVDRGNERGRVGELMRGIAGVSAVVAFFCVLLGAASNSRAAQASVQGVSINLPVPAGFCELSSSNPVDKRMLDTVGNLVAKSRGNALLAMSADCQQLSDWRAGRRLLGDYGQYQAPPNAAANEETFKETCAALRNQGGQTLSDVKKDLKARMEESVRQMKVDDQRFAGFLGEDAIACYVALLQKLKAEDGTEVTQLTVLAITSVKDRFLFVNRYAPYVNVDTVDDTLEKLKGTIAALQAANHG
jgi:hypothetical protein